MKKLDEVSLEEIKKWVYRNARPLELAIWQYEFENGSKEAVLSSLSNYQNDDGGFGNSLEPDLWNPNSSPYTTFYAIEIIKKLNFTDTKHPIMQGIFRFIESRLHSNENGWLFSIPSNDQYPHAPWWTYNKNANEYESIGVTAGICCFILTFASKESKIYGDALSITDKLIAWLSMTGNKGDMGVGGYCELIETLPQLGLSNRYDMDSIINTVKKLVDQAMEHDVAKWAFYGKTPASFIKSPDSFLYKENEELMQIELDYIIEKRQENGVWNITWSWFDHNEIYAKEFAISENWWKSVIAIDKLKLLRNFDRIG